MTICIIPASGGSKGLWWVRRPPAVASAVPAERKAATYVTVWQGGEGAGREGCDLILQQRVEAVV